jgi:hypothetical protein
MEHRPQTALLTQIAGAQHQQPAFSGVGAVGGMRVLVACGLG